ncbi:MAG: hypothetical protein NVSMB21_04590 [Vulcanimicrobiaceae bacterium]
MPYADVAGSVASPGISLAAPRFDGRLDGRLAGVGEPGAFQVGGRVGGRNLRVGRMSLATVSGDVAGPLGDLRLGGLTASGPWGAFAGTGSYRADELALRGTYHGSFERLANLTGDLGGAGSLEGPLAVLVSPQRTIVQSAGAASIGASVRGVPIERPEGTIAVSGSRVRVYAASGSVASGRFVAAGTLDGMAGLGVSLAGAASARLRAVVPLGGDASVALIGRYGHVGPAARFEGGLALGAGSTYDRLPIDGNGDLTLLGDGVRFGRTDARVGPASGSLDGRLDGLGTRAPHYDANLHIGTLRIDRLARSLAPTEAISGTLLGDLHLVGSGRGLSLAGRIAVPEATVNGLAVRDGTVDVAVDGRGFAALPGSLTVGSTRTAFAASSDGPDVAVRVDAPRADLADFNDFFDAGDMLGGRGRIAARFVRRGPAVRTSADISIARLAVRRFDLGDASARWTSRGPSVTGAVAFGGASGRLETAGVLRLAAQAPLDRLLQRSRFDGTARLRGLDLGVWLPALGYQVPILGRVDGDATIAGPLRNPSVRTEASLHGGSIGTFPVDRFDVAASSTLRETTVTRAVLDLPTVSLTGSGRFGAAPTDPIAFGIHAKSQNVGALAARLSGAGRGLTGTGEVDLKIGGTASRPRLAGGFDLEAASLRGVAVPRALGQFTLSGRDIVLSSVEVAFATGTLLLAGSVPLQISPFALGPAAAPIALDLGARGIDLADFAPLLPPGSQLRGKLDGRVAIGGTAGAPRLHGALAVAGGTIVSPLETNPLTDLGATLVFEGNDATLEALHASAGGGTLDATGSANFPNLVRPGLDATYRLRARARRLRLDLPAYGTGVVEGTLSLDHRPGHVPVLGGGLTLADATIPFSALAGADSGTAAGPRRPPVALDLTVAAARNVRVRSSNVDIGARGDLHLGGTSLAPELDGAFTSTGGTLTYVNTVFRLVAGTVRFEPDLGLVPTLDARAVAHVSDPDPNTVRNLAGTADVTLDVTGPVNGLSIALSSDPAYDRQQILGLLLSAPAFGASSLFGAPGGSPTPYGSTSPGAAPPGYLATRNGNGQFSVAQEAFGVANAQFTRTLLAPIESSFARAVGLSNFNVNVDYSGAVGVSARKVLGKKINAVYGTSFGYPYRQTFGFEFKPNDATAAQMTVFQTLGASGLSSLAPPSYQSGDLKLQASQPTAGTVGFSLSLQRLFK